MSLLLLLTGQDSDTDPAVAYAAVRGDVARLLRARTKARIATGPLGNTGNELGEFTGDTRPTGDQVDALIMDAASSVAARVGLAIPTEHEWIARRVVAIRTAMLIELSYFPEQTDGDNTIYQRLSDLYDETLSSLEGVLTDNEAGQSRIVSIPITSPTLAAYNAVFPVSSELLP
jgi:hypothetical protein